MLICTPLSPSALRVMLLGAGELGKELIIALQRLGFEVIAVDRYENAPGQQVAHRAHVIPMTDGAALRRLIELEKPHLIVPEIEAIATDTLVDIETAGLAEVIPTARAARLTMNREGIRRLAAEELGLPTSPYQFADSLAELQAAIDAGIGYPCIVKPVMSSSGKGQSLLRGPEDVQKAWDYAASGGRVNAGRVIVEGFIDFDYEITLLTVRARGADGTVHTSFCEPISHLQVAGDYVESWQPQPMSSAALARAQEIAAAITGNLGRRGLFGVELFVKGDMVWFSEVSPRPHDHRAGHPLFAALLGVRTARPRHPRPAGRHHAARSRCLGGHLRRGRSPGHRLRRRRRGAAGAAQRPAPVRQAGVVHQTPDGRRRRQRRGCATARERAKLAAGKVRPHTV